METQILLAGNLDLIEKGELGITKKDIKKNRKNVKSADKVFRKQTLESWTPGILGPFSPTKLDKNQTFKLSHWHYLATLLILMMKQQKKGQI